MRALCIVEPKHLFFHALLSLYFCVKTNWFNNSDGNRFGLQSARCNQIPDFPVPKTSLIAVIMTELERERINVLFIYLFFWFIFTSVYLTCARRVHTPNNEGLEWVGVRVECEKLSFASRSLFFSLISSFVVLRLFFFFVLIIICSSCLLPPRLLFGYRREL